MKDRSVNPNTTCMEVLYGNENKIGHFRVMHIAPFLGVYTND